MLNPDVMNVRILSARLYISTAEGFIKNSWWPEAKLNLERAIEGYEEALSILRKIATNPYGHRLADIEKELEEALKLCESLRGRQDSERL